MKGTLRMIDDAGSEFSTSSEASGMKVCEDAFKRERK